MYPWGPRAAQKTTVGRYVEMRQEKRNGCMLLLHDEAYCLSRLGLNPLPRQARQEGQAVTPRKCVGQPGQVWSIMPIQR